MGLRTIATIVIGGFFICVFAVPAGWIQASLIQGTLDGERGGWLSRQPLLDRLTALHASHVFIVLAGIGFLWLVIMPVIRICLADRSRGLAFLALLLGVSLICLLAAPAALLPAAATGDRDAMLGIAGVLIFGAGLSFYLIGESPFVSFGYLAWALIGTLSFNHLGALALEQTETVGYWTHLAAVHAGGASVLLSLFALLETRAHLNRARGSGVLSALLAITLCLSAAVMVLYQYRTGFGGVAPEAALTDERAAEDLLRAGVASSLFLLAGLLGFIRHLILMRRAAAPPQEGYPSTS